jgi:2-keto-3-deoxy-L-rhamnonate aldolase RhmA
MKLTNPVRDKMKAGGVALGMTVRIGRSPDIARIAKTTGHDFIFIDGQHSIFNLETITSIAHTALAIGVTPMVRVRGVDDLDVSLLLDNGVTGIIYPDISTAAEARRAVEVCRFPPFGKRSVVGGYPHFDYRPVPLSQSVPQLNEACLLVCMIETVEGLNNIEEIAGGRWRRCASCRQQRPAGQHGQARQVRRSRHRRGPGSRHPCRQGARPVRRLRWQS